MLWPTAAKKIGNWHRGIVDAADRFMKRWHRGKAEKSWQRPTAEDAKSSKQGKRGGRGWGGSRTDTAVQMNAETKRQIMWQGTSSTN